MTKRLDPGGGGLTGVTGDLTPDESAAPFVPGERLEQTGNVGGPAELGGRESGYGSDHGSSPHDNADRTEVPSSAGCGAEQPSSPAPEPRQGVDDVTDHEERF